MFQWNEEMVRFMRVASEYGDYHLRLADWMLPDLRAADHVCDAGCGLGYLSLALAPHVRRVTAADRSAEALSVLRENCAARGIGNIALLAGDLFSAAPQSRGTVFAFKKNYATHRFSVESHPTGDDSFSAGVSWLTEHGVPFVSQELELEMGQPFCSWESARRFFEIYSRDEDKSVITDDFLRSKLVETGREDFPLYLPQKRSVGCLKFSSKDL